VLAGRPLDAVVSSTALHWVSGADLARVYRAWIDPIYDFQVEALHEAGFREVGTFWQRRDNRILVAIR
jgi:hypothetical protein